MNFGEYLQYAHLRNRILRELFFGESHRPETKIKKSTLRRPATTEIPIEVPINKEQKKAERCYHCGLVWKIDHNCIAINRTCFKCGKKGHFTRVCGFLDKTIDKNKANVDDIGNASSNDKNEKLERPCGNSKTDVNNTDDVTEINSNVCHKNKNSKIKKSGIKVTKRNANKSKKPVEIQIDDETVNTMFTREKFFEMKKNAEIYYEQKNYKLTMLKYLEIIKKYADSKNYYKNCLVCHIMAGHSENALSDIATTDELQSEYIKGYRRVIECAVALGNFIEAKIRIEQFEKINPNDALIITARNNIENSKCYSSNADDAEARENYNEALENIDKALRICTHCIKYKIKKGEYLVLLKRYKDAEIIAKDILNHEPSDIDAKYIRGVCMYQSNPEEAMSYLNNILRLESDDPKFGVIYEKVKAFVIMKKNGNDLYRKGNYFKAHKFYTDALNIDSDNMTMNKILYNNQAQASYKMRNIKRSIVECTKALAIDPQYVNALICRGQCYIEQKEYEKAIDDLRKACNIDSTRACQNLLKKAIMLLNAANSDYHGILGVKYNASQYEIKKAYKEKALQHHPDRHVNSSCMEKIENERMFKRITQAYRVLTNSYEKK